MRSIGTDDCLRLPAGRVVCRTATRAAELLSRTGELRLSLTRDATPISDAIVSLQRPVRLQASVFSCDARVTDALEALRRRGRVLSQHWILDAQTLGQTWTPEDLARWQESITGLRTGPVHSKWFAIRTTDGAHSLLSSSNDGCEAGHTEWWASSTATAVADWLETGEGSPLAAPVQCETEGMTRASRLLPWPLAPITLLRCGPETPSGDVLRWLLRGAGASARLTLVSYSTSIGFVRLLARQPLASLDWLMDRSLRGRKGTGSEGNVIAALDDLLPGRWREAPGRIHGKWAVIRAAGLAISVLSSSNWQETNPREESYVVLTDPAVADWLEAVYPPPDVAAAAPVVLRGISDLTPADRRMICLQRYRDGWEVDRIVAWWARHAFLLPAQDVDEICSRPPADVLDRLDRERSRSGKRRKWMADRRSLARLLTLLGRAAEEAGDAGDVTELRQAVTAYTATADAWHRMPSDGREHGRVPVSSLLELTDAELLERWRDLV